MQLKFAEVPTPMAATFVIVDDLSVEAILGLDFLEQCNADVHYHLMWSTFEP